MDSISGLGEPAECTKKVNDSIDDDQDCLDGVRSAVARSNGVVLAVEISPFA